MASVRLNVDRVLNGTRKVEDDTKFSSSKSSPSKPKRKRKILKPLQRSAQDEKTLVGNDRPDTRRKSGKRKLLDTALDSPRKIQRTIFSYMSPLKIYQDPEENNENEVPGGVTPTEDNIEKEKTKSRDENKAPEPELDSEAERLMVNEEIPVEYWREVAEKRREALAEALDENENLHEENKNLKEKVETLNVENGSLKEENEGLKGMAEKAEYFANMVNLLMTDENVEDEATVPETSTAEESDTDPRDNSCDDSSKS